MTPGSALLILNSLPACDFARATDRPAMIGALGDIDRLVIGEAGTRICTDVDGVVTTPSPSLQED